MEASNTPTIRRLTPLCRHQLSYIAQELTAGIDRVNVLTEQLPTEERKALAGVVSPLKPTLNQLFDKVLTIPGASDTLKPTVDALKAKLAALTA